MNSSTLPRFVLVVLTVSAWAVERPANAQVDRRSRTQDGRRGSDPGFYPAPSLSPNRVSNPPGSLNSSQVFNPNGSFFRPRDVNSGASSGSGQIAADRLENRRPLGLSGGEWTLSQVGEEKSLAGISQLEQSLKGYKNGAAWSNHLQLAKLRELISQSSDAEKAKPQLTEIFQKFQSIAANDDYRDVRSLPGFDSVSALLATLVLDEQDLLRKYLIAEWQHLSDVFEGKRSGDSWQKYLACPWDDETIERPDSTNSSGDTDDKELQKVRATLARFQTVSREQRYQKVASLPEFKQTMQLLTNYVDAVQTVSLRDEEKAPAAKGGP